MLDDYCKNTKYLLMFQIYLKKKHNKQCLHACPSVKCKQAVQDQPPKGESHRDQDATESGLLCSVHICSYVLT